MTVTYTILKFGKPPGRDITVTVTGAMAQMAVRWMSEQHKAGIVVLEIDGQPVGKQQQGDSQCTSATHSA